MVVIIVGMRPCIETILIVYPFFVMAGMSFFRAVTKKSPHKDAKRNRALIALRFMLYVILLPLGAVLSLAVMGFLDPLFFLIKNHT